MLTLCYFVHCWNFEKGMVYFEIITFACISKSAASSATSSEPRPTGIRIGAPGGTFQLGGMPGLPPGLGGMFRGQMPFMQGRTSSFGEQTWGSSGLMDKVSASQPLDRGFEPYKGHDHDTSLFILHQYWLVPGSGLESDFKKL